MPITLRPTSGTTVSASAADPATFDAAGYGALTWTAVAGFSNIGEVGNAYETGNFDSLTDGRIKYRTIADPGTLDASMADLPADAGQAILKAAFDAPRSSNGEVISLRVQDASGRGTYMQVKVASWRRAYGGAADVQMRMASMYIEAGSVVEY